MNLSQRLILVWFLIECPFTLCVSAVGLPATVTLGDLAPTYDGTGKTPSFVTQPSELNVSWRFVDPTASPPQPVTETVFRNIPSTLDLSYLSYAFEVQKTWGIGDYVQLGGTARDLESVDVVMVTWAKAANYPVLAAANPTGWHHPVTIKIYARNATGELDEKGTVTRNIFVPWRPLTQADGSAYLYNGYAFLAHFDFPAGVILPEQSMILVTFNTQHAGFAPIGTTDAERPYNELNVASNGDAMPVTGSDILTNNTEGILRVANALTAPWTDPPTYTYPANGPPPMFTIQANRTPAAGTANPPVNAGTWQVTATINDPSYEGSATGTLVIGKANATISLDNLTAIYDGTSKSVSTTTGPTNRSVVVTYNGSLEPPIALGKYAVHATIQDPNYQGSTDGEMWLGHTLASWLGTWVQNGRIDATATGVQDDPDHDSICNLLEYAGALDPAAVNPELPGNGVPQVQYANGQLSLIYRKNLTATDLDFQVETATCLDDPVARWAPATTVDTVVGTVGTVQTIRAALVVNPSEPRRFMRLNVRCR